DCRPLVRQRALSAAAALAELPAARLDSRADALDAAAALFDAHLYFEVHELLEPFWRDAGGGEREALQGLIQIAVGYQHLANGRRAGAGALGGGGRRGREARSLGGMAPDPCGGGVGRTPAGMPQLDGRTAPPFPRSKPGQRAGRAAGKDVNPRKEL